MRASWLWLRELSGVESSVEEAAARLTAAGIEVEEIEYHGEGLDRVVVAEVRSVEPHPSREGLRVVTVFDGAAERSVVCGAPNVPGPGGRVLLALSGARLPSGATVEPRTLGGVRSEGMLCSEAELGLGPDESGLLILRSQDTSAPAGTPLPEAVEGVRDAIFELGITPNRADALGHVGLARELRALFGAPFVAEPPPAPPNASEPLELQGLWQVDAPHQRVVELPWPSRDVSAPLPGAPFSVHIEEPSRCPRYTAAIVTGVSPRPSPLALRIRLHRLGVRPLDGVVDATNLVLLEEGHPVHAFDLERLSGGSLVVRLARAGERLRTLDGVERVLDADDLLICDAEGPVALAGVMGGERSEVRERTRHVLLECALFDPRSVRRTARRHGLHTEASHRFERGVDPLGLPRVLAKAVARIADLGGGRPLGTWIDVEPRSLEPPWVPMRPRRLEALLGTSVPTAEAVDILERLGCRVDTRNEVELRVRVPSWRGDLRREQDLFEEVARVRGYDSIPAELPRVRPSGVGGPPMLRLQRRLLEASATAGLLEAVCYAFVSESDLRAARVDSGGVVRLHNPLSEERAVMRTSLLPGLAAAARHAQRRQVARLRLCEVGRVFFPSEGEEEASHAVRDPLPPTGVRESPRYGVLLCGPRASWPGDGPPMDLYDWIGVVQQVIEGVTGRVPEAVLGEERQRPGWAHPRRWGLLRLAERELGTFGELHPEVVESLELQGRPQYGELDLEALLRALDALGDAAAPSLPRFPAVTRDLAMVVRDEVTAADLLSAARDAAGPLLEDIEVVDLYRGEGIPKGSRSLALRLVFRDPEATLTDTRAERLAEQVLRRWEESFGARLRGSS